ncbi:MAG: hypothetical protein WBH31_15800 [Promethearchaeia archaeon]
MSNWEIFRERLLILIASEKFIIYKVHTKTTLRSEWIGTIYNMLNDAPKALQNFERALQIYEQLGLENQIQQVRENISKLSKT